MIARALGARVVAVDRGRFTAVVDESSDDERLVTAVRAKQLVEPSSAIALAAVLAEPARFAGRRVGIVLSGGNVDPDHLPWCA